jgi:ketosteroid isomerase-like protein
LRPERRQVALNRAAADLKLCSQLLDADFTPRSEAVQESEDSGRTWHEIAVTGCQGSSNSRPEPGLRLGLTGELQMNVQPHSAEAEVISAVEAMTNAFHRGALDEILGTYRAGAVVAFEPGTASQGDQALAEGFRGFIELSPRFTYSGHDVLVAGDLALHIAPWSMTATAPDGSKIEQHGLSVAVLLKSQPGGWKLVIDNPYGGRLLSDEAN